MGNFEDPLPLIEGYTYERTLVIKNCPFCGYPHFHGNKDYPIGYMTARTKHCASFSDDYVIIVKGTITTEEYESLEDRIQPFEQKGTLEYIARSEYLDYCDKRGSWT